MPDDEIYRVKLENIFEGPMDLLVHLIKKNEMDIYDIQISVITQQYLEYLEWLKMLNIDVAGDFLVLASTLAQIKSRMLIPAHEIIEFSDEPCINCGGCVDACPVNLQVQMIGRYAEFGFFDRAEDQGLFYCIECGLCASICTARRPLVQLIRLAKSECKKKQALIEAARSEEVETETQEE